MSESIRMQLTLPKITYHEILGKYVGTTATRKNPQAVILEALADFLANDTLHKEEKP